MRYKVECDPDAQARYVENFRKAAVAAFDAGIGLDLLVRTLTESEQHVTAAHDAAFEAFKAVMYSGVAAFGRDRPEPDYEEITFRMMRDGHHQVWVTGRGSPFGKAAS